MVASAGVAMTYPQKMALAIFGGLLLLCAGLVIAADFLGPSVRSSLLPAATEGFKIVLGAMVGALSAILGVSSR